MQIDHPNASTTLETPMLTQRPKRQNISHNNNIRTRLFLTIHTLSFDKTKQNPRHELEYPSLRSDRREFLDESTARKCRPLIEFFPGHYLFRRLIKSPR